MSISGVNAVLLTTNMWPHYSLMDILTCSIGGTHRPAETQMYFQAWNMFFSLPELNSKDNAQIKAHREEID